MEREEHSPVMAWNSMHVEGQSRALLLIAGAQLLALSLWFSASAVADSLQSAWELTDAQVPLLTLAVQIGFVVGALLSALLTLADRVKARYLFAVSAIAGALINGLLVILGPGVICRSSSRFDSSRVWLLRGCIRAV